MLQLQPIGTNGAQMEIMCSVNGSRIHSSLKRPFAGLPQAFYAILIVQLETLPFASGSRKINTTPSVNAIICGTNKTFRSLS